LAGFKKRNGAVKKRTSIWLADELRKRLDVQCEAEDRSLTDMIQTLLREGLAKRAKRGAPNASVFG
jgi:hypothetical protein